MFKYFLLLFCVTTIAYGQVVRNVRLVDHEGYFMRLVQRTMNEVEEAGWCNLKIPDFTQNLDQKIYGWHLNGTVSYKNGFLVSVGSMNLERSTVQQIWSHNAATDTSAVNVRGILWLLDVALGYDVEVELDGKTEIQHFTGVYTHERVGILLNVQKTLPQNVTTTGSSIDTLSTGGARRVIFHPSNELTEVLQRQYIASDAWNGISSWGTNVFTPTMLKLTTAEIPFPEICYNCAAS